MLRSREPTETPRRPPTSLWVGPGAPGCEAEQRDGRRLPGNPGPRASHSDGWARSALLILQVSPRPPPNRTCTFQRIRLSRGRHSLPGLLRGRIPFRFALHRSYNSGRSGLVPTPGRFPPAALRLVAGFPDLRLLRRLRRCPCFTDGLSSPFLGQPPVFLRIDSARQFRWRLSVRPTRSLRFLTGSGVTSGLPIAPFGR
jgi:hypothetical protein